MKKFAVPVIAVILLTASIISAQETINFTTFLNMNDNCYGMAYANNGRFIFSSGGGTNMGNSFLRTVTAYDPANDTWKVLAQGLVPRRYHNMEYVPSLNKIFIFNGEYSQDRSFTLNSTLYAIRRSKIKFTDIIDVIDLNKNEITTLSSIPYPVMHAGSAVWNNKIYVFGGWNPMGYTDKVYEYDPAEDDWNELDEMPEEMQTTGTIVDGVIYTFGGLGDAGEVKAIYAYNIKDEKWNKVGELPVSVNGCAVTTDGKNIWLVGSKANTNFIAMFDTATKTLKVLNSNMIGRMDAGAQVIGKSLIIFGGLQNENSKSALNNTQSANISKYIQK